MFNYDQMLGMSPIDLMARLLILFTAFPIHEYAHASMAVRLGDQTPINQGRLTLNPFSHLTGIGSVAMVFLGFGWAKPVQTSSRNFKKPKRDMLLVALAGPVANLLMAVLMTVIVKLIIGYQPFIRESSPYYIPLVLCSYMAQINVLLALFNLLPIPPLDGSRILPFFLSSKVYYKMLGYSHLLSVAVLVLMYTGILYIPLEFLMNLFLQGINFITRPVDWLTAALF